MLKITNQLKNNENGEKLICWKNNVYSKREKTEMKQMQQVVYMNIHVKRVAPSALRKSLNAEIEDP